MNTENITEQAIEYASDRLLNKHELAKRLGVSSRTVDDWQRRKLICFLKIGRSCRYRWADIVEKLNQYRVN